MKKHLLFFLVMVTIFSFSCTKSWMEDRIEGAWRLKSAERNSFLNWTTFNTGYEDGRFEFQNNGIALYSENQVSMKGDWWIRRVTDSYSNDDNDQHLRMAFSVHLIDFTAQKTINLEFDEMHFRGRNRFIAKYESSAHRYRYEFVRY